MRGPDGHLFADSRTMWNHWVIRASTPHTPFHSFESASWIWNRMTKLYPEALAAVLMPNHIHLILPARSEATDLNKLCGLMGAMSGYLRISRLWQQIPPPAKIPDTHHLKRQLRYVALNPCRAGLCQDPLSWPWSTHRELVGAVAHPWISASKIAHALGDTKRDFANRFHSYVSGDPSVSLSGTPFPTPPSVPSLPMASLGDLLFASSAALRKHPKEVQKRTNELRRVFVHLCVRQGWRQTALLAQTCRTSPRTLQRIYKTHPPHGLKAAERCLADPRLRMGLPPLSELFAVRTPAGSSALTPRSVVKRDKTRISTVG